MFVDDEGKMLLPGDFFAFMLLQHLLARLEFASEHLLQKHDLMKLQHHRQST
jgi:hypothetical protein